MENRPGTAPAKPDWRLLGLLAAAPLVLHLACSFTPGYGYFIDEFYYVACSKRLAFGYVDHPPLAPWLLAGVRALLGDSVLAIRVAAFAALSATVWVTGLIVARLGGRRSATLVAGLSVGLSPVMLAMTGFYSMNAFEPLLWTLAVLAVIRVLQTGESRGWLLVGLLVGLAFENKHTIVAFLLALGVGLVLTPVRKALRDRWFWAGATLAALMAAPNIAWQVMNGWPSIEFYRNAHLLKNAPASPVGSVLAQVLTQNPVTLPLWVGGLVYLLAGPERRWSRCLGIFFIAAFVTHVASRTSRPDRLAAAYPLLFAAGAVAMERLRLPGNGIGTRAVRALRSAAPVLIVVTALPILPYVIPVLPPAQLARYVSLVGYNAQAERGKSSSIPQLLADRTGWESFIDDMARAYSSLPEEDRRRAEFFAPSYGQAGALELLGPRRGLPARVVSNHNTYWHWSAGHANADVLVAVAADEDDLRQLFADVTEVGRVRCEFCMSWRNDVPVAVARRSIRPVESVWARVRHYE